MGLLTPWMDKNEKRALAAVKKLSDQKKLTQAALHAPAENTRAAAVLKLSDQVIIERIAATDSSVYVRMKALSVCSSNMFLAQFACKINHIELAITAVKNMYDQQLLAQVALETYYRDVCVAAAERINDEALLVHVAAGMPEYGAWKVLDKIAQFPDAAEQFKILSESAKGPKVRSDSKSRYADAVNDPLLFLTLAREQKNYMRDFVKRVEDIELLENTMQNDADPALRETILNINIEKLSDSALLSFSLCTDNNISARGEAACQLLERDFVKNSTALSPILDGCLDGYYTLIYVLAKHGDPRAVVPLEALALRPERKDKATAPRALGKIPTVEAVNALLRIMKTDQIAAEYAQQALMDLYRSTKSGDIHSAIAAIPQKVYHTHTDMGESSRSCHEDIPSVHFDLGGSST